MQEDIQNQDITLCETGKYDYRKSIQNHSTYGRAGET